MSDILIFMAIGISAGVLSGMFGIGGGVIIIPALVYIAGFTQLKAQGTSLAILLPPVGLLAFMQYYKNGHVDVRAAIAICATVFLGAMFGAKFVQHVPVELLKKGFSVLLMAIAVKMFFGR
jgi:uncharacterized protein